MFLLKKCVNDHVCLSVGDYHKFEPKIEEFWLEVFVQQFVFAEVKCKMSVSVFAPVRQKGAA